MNNRARKYFLIFVSFCALPSIYANKEESGWISTAYNYCAKLLSKFSLSSLTSYNFRKKNTEEYNFDNFDNLFIKNRPQPEDFFSILKNPSKYQEWRDLENARQKERENFLNHLRIFLNKK